MVADNSTENDSETPGRADLATSEPASEPAKAMADEGRGDEAEKAETPEPSKALLARGSLFKRLGRDALHCVLPFLDLRSLGALDSAMTNRAEREEPWLPAVSQMDNKVLSEVLSEDLWVSDKPVKVVQWLSCFKWVTSKDVALPLEFAFPRELPDVNIYLACLEKSSKLHKIIRLGVEQCESVTVAGLGHMKRCTGLKSFTLWVEKAPYLLKELAKIEWPCFKTLECVDLNDCYVDGDCISALASQCPVLKELTITFSRRNFTTSRLNLDALGDDETVLRLSEMKALEILSVPYAHGISLEAHSFVKGLTKLHTLAINRSRYADVLLDHLATMPSIRELTLSHCGRLTAAAFEHFRGGLANLTGLELEECNIIGNNLAAISGMKSIQRLHIIQGEMNYLQPDGELIDIIDDALVHVRGLTTLYELYVSTEGVTDAGMVHLNRLPLTKLVVGHSQITDVGLDTLHSLSPKLRDLGLWHLDFITEAGVERLLSACKHIKKASVGGRQISYEHWKSLKDRFF